MFNKAKIFCQKCGIRLREGMVNNNLMDMKQGLFCTECGESQRQENINEYNKKR